MENLEMNETLNFERFDLNGSTFNVVVDGQSEDVEKIILEREKEEYEESLEKYMPIGSIIATEDLENLKMIIGFKVNNNGNDYDYVACEYPFGISADKEYFFFNHDDIVRIYHVGYVNEQEKYFKSQMSQNDSENILR